MVNNGDLAHTLATCPGIIFCDKYKHPGECPFAMYGDGCVATMHIEAARRVLNKPVVLTLDEVKSSKGKDLFVEISGYPESKTYLTAVTIDGVGTEGISTYGRSFDYRAYGHRNYGWRCWTARPEQWLMEATKWME